MEKLFTQLEVSKTKEEREDWIYQIELQIEENQEYLDLIIKYIYKLLVSTNWELRKSGSLIFNYFCKYLNLFIPQEFYKTDTNFKKKYKEIREKELLEYFKGNKLFQTQSEFLKNYQILYEEIHEKIDFKGKNSFFSCEESTFNEALINQSVQVENIAKELKLNLEVDNTKFLKQIEKEELKPKKLSRQQTLMMKRKKMKIESSTINIQNKVKEIKNIKEFFEVTHLNLTHENWNIRHGAFLTYCGLIDYLITEKKFNSTSIFENNSIILPDDLINKSLEMLYLDKFSDFNLDITKAPVRDASSLLISQLIQFTSYDFVIFNLINLIINNIDNWQIQISGLICLKRIQSKLTEFDKLYSIYLMIQISYFANDDDVKILSSEFLKDNFYLLKNNNIIPKEIILKFNNDVLFFNFESYLWDQISLSDTISNCVISYLILLDEIYKKTKLINENQLKLLSNFSRSQIIDIRLAVVKFLQNSFPSKYNNFIYSLLIQNLLIETDLNIIELTKSSLLKLKFNSFLFVVTENILTTFKKKWFGIKTIISDNNMTSLDSQFFSGGIKSLGENLLTENRLRYFDYLSIRSEKELIKEIKPNNFERIESTLYYLLYKLIIKEINKDKKNDFIKREKINKEDFIETKKINNSNWKKMIEKGSLCSLNLEFNSSFLNFIRIQIVINILNNIYSNTSLIKEFEDDILFIYIKIETCKSFLKFIFKYLIKNNINDEILKILTQKCMEFQKNYYIFFQIFSYEFLETKYFLEMKSNLINSSSEKINNKILNLTEKNIQNFFIQTLPFYENLKNQMDFLFYYCLEIKNIKENFIFGKQILKTFCKKLKYNYLIIQRLIKLLKENLEDFLKENYEKQQNILNDFDETELYYILSLIILLIQNHNYLFNPLLLHSIITSINILGNKISYLCLSELIPTLQNSLTKDDLINIKELESEGIKIFDILQLEKNKIEKLFDTKKINSKINPKIKGVNLREYQIKGIQWLEFLYDLGANGILADDMGLGKTLQIISFITIIKEKENDFSTLIICPSSIIGHWDSEIKKYSNLKSKIITRNTLLKESDSFSNYDILISTFDTIRFIYLNELNGIEIKNKIFKYLVIDEAHVIKNPETKIYKTICQLKAKNKILLTGTPVQNSISDIINLFNFIMPNYIKNDCKNLKEIHEKTLPFILRRLKSNVLKDLPEKIVMDIKIDLLKEQRELYNSLSSIKDISYSNYENNKKSNSFQIINKQLKICSHPKLLGKSIESAKLNALLDLFSIEMKKTLIFFQYKQTLKIISLSLPKNSFLILDGSISINKRYEIVENFNNNMSISFLLLTTSIGGLGLNLTSASTVIFYEHDWNPFNDLQAMDRAHRIGQKYTVNVYRLICKDTIEERIMSLQKFKKHVAETLVNQQNFNIESMDMENFLERFNSQIQLKIKEINQEINESDEILDLY